METKYLSDGRKVTIVGKLNNTEYIVQEIFISDSGDEISSGERFVVKSLHDKPIETWASRELKKHEEYKTRLEREVKEVETKIKNEKLKLSTYKDLVLSSKEFIDIGKQNLENLAMFISGECEYLVEECSYSLRFPIRFEDAISQRDNWYRDTNYEGLKLLSFFGLPNGNIKYKMNQYRDGSGSWTTIHPFKDYKSALEFVKEQAIKLANEGRLYKENYDKCINLGIVFPEEVNTLILSNIKALINKNIDSLNNDIKKIQEQINKHNLDIDSLK